MPDPVNPLDIFGAELRGNLKTFITAGVMLIAMVLSAFKVVELTTNQLVAMTGSGVFLAFIFQRIATLKAQKAAGAAQAAATAAKATAAQTLAAVETIKPRRRKPAAKGDQT